MGSHPWRRSGSHADAHRFGGSWREGVDRAIDANAERKGLTCFGGRKAIAPTETSIARRLDRPERVPAAPFAWLDLDFDASAWQPAQLPRKCDQLASPRRWRCDVRRQARSDGKAQAASRGRLSVARERDVGQRDGARRAGPEPVGEAAGRTCRNRCDLRPGFRSWCCGQRLGKCGFAGGTWCFAVLRRVSSAAFR